MNDAARFGQRLPFDHYHADIRDALKQLAARFDPEAIADAAQALADDIAQHGPKRDPDWTQLTIVEEP